MEKVKIVTLVLFAASVVLVFLPKSEGQLRPPQLTPRPLCASQFSLANYACALLPVNPLPLTPPPSPPDDDDDEERHHHRHEHRHRHRGRSRHRRHRHRLTPAVENCCRWASQIDGQCVCELLFLLPGFANFLMRPVHEYTLRIGDSCNVTYVCGGTLMRT